MAGWLAGWHKYRAIYEISIYIFICRCFQHVSYLEKDPKA